MLNYLLYISSCIVICAYLGYFFLLLKYNKKTSDNNNCIGILTDALSEYNGINIILSKGIFSYYNIQRKVIKLTEKCYYGDTISYLAVALIETGYFISDKLGNRFINLCKKVIPTLKILYILPIISIVINNSIYNSNDGVIGIILIFLFIYISYLIINMKKDICLWILENIELKKYSGVDMVIKFVNRTIILEWLIIIGQFMMICRFLLLMML